MCANYRCVWNEPISLSLTYYWVREGYHLIERKWTINYSKHSKKVSLCYFIHLRVTTKFYFVISNIGFKLGIEGFGLSDASFRASF
jgi:hypothetical protein